MKQWQLAGSTAATALILGMSAAAADVTPEEIWQNWQDMTTSYGQAIKSTSVTRNGDTLQVEGAAISTDDGKGTATNVQMGTINFKDLGDGTVEVTLPDSYPISMKTPAKDETSQPLDLAITLSQPGMKIIASGTAAETGYAISAPSMNIKITDASGASPDNSGDITLTGVTGKYLVAGTDTKTLDSAFAAKSMDIAINAKETAEPFDMKLTASYADLTGTSKGTFLGVAAMENMATALQSGFAVDGGFSYGKNTFNLQVTDETGPTQIAATSDGGSLTVGLDKSRLSYGVASKAAAFTISGASIPIPEVKVSYSEVLFNLAMPVAKSDTPEDFAFTTKIVDLAMSDDIWAMVDPTGGLPHDPATIILDTKGTAKLTVDLMDEAATAALGDAPPGELNALDLTDLTVKIAGAALTGSGALTFDNTDLTTFQGMPVPTGKIDLKLVGANTLLDKLIAMGLVAEDQAMGFRMMAGMFTKVGEGEDTLTSTLEFKDKGFFANGQQLQ